MKRIGLSVLLIFGVSSFATATPLVAELLPSEYRSRVITAERPLLLKFRFDGKDDNRIAMKVVNYPQGPSDLFFYHMHANEKTSLREGLELVKKNGGTVMIFTHPGEGRLLKIRLDGVVYEIDPNRIFTEKALVEKTAPRPSPAHLKKLTDFVDWTKENIRRGLAQRGVRLVTALHNNTDDDHEGRLLSILTEKEIVGVDNLEAHQAAGWDIDNFFITTQKSAFARLLKREDANISLRLPQPRDIGYLSNWMIKDGVSYINIEAQHGDAAASRHMIQMVLDAFK